MKIKASDLDEDHSAKHMATVGCLVQMWPGTSGAQEAVLWAQTPPHSLTPQVGFDQGCYTPNNASSKEARVLSAAHRSFNVRPIQSISKNPSLLQDMEHDVCTACLKRLTDHIYSNLASSICQGKKKKAQNQSSDDKFLKLL